MGKGLDFKKLCCDVGYTLLEKDDKEEALKIFKLASGGSTPDYGDIEVLRTITLYLTNRIDEAIASMKEVLALNSLGHLNKHIGKYYYIIDILAYTIRLENRKIGLILAAISLVLILIASLLLKKIKWYSSLLYIPAGGLGILGVIVILSQIGMYPSSVFYASLFMPIELKSVAFVDFVKGVFPYIIAFGFTALFLWAIISRFIESVERHSRVDPDACPRCRGQGTIVIHGPSNPASYSPEDIDLEPCPDCGGTGRRRTSKER